MVSQNLHANLKIAVNKQDKRNQASIEIKSTTAINLFYRKLFYYVNTNKVNWNHCVTNQLAL